MLCLLDPKHSQSPDITSYFKQMTSSTGDEPSEVLPQVPVAGLKRKTYGSSRRTAKLSTHPTKVKGSSVNQEATSRPQLQPTILKAFAKYQPAVKQKDTDEISLPDNILDDFCKFDLSPLECEHKDEKDFGIGHCLAGERDTAESQCGDENQQETPIFIHNNPDLSIEPKGTKYQRLTTVHSSYSIADKNEEAQFCQLSPAKEQCQRLTAAHSSDFIADESKKAKFCLLSPAKKQQNTGTKRKLPSYKPNYSDPFDELAADQTKAKNGSSTGVHVIKRQWMEISDEDSEDENIADLKGKQDLFGEYMWSSAEPSTTTTHSCADVQEEAVDSFPTSSPLKLQQSSLRNTKTTLSQVSTTSPDMYDLTTKDIEDMLFDIRTPNIELSPTESFETEKDLHGTPCLLQPKDLERPSIEKRSASQPAPHSLSVDQESKGLVKRYSDSVLETNKFGDITNTIMSPDGDGDISPKKKSGSASVNDSIVDLTQTPGTFVYK